MSKNLLIVEDEKDIRKLITMYFRNEPFNIFEAEDGLQAIKIFDSNKIDIIILDIMIPEIDGLNVLKHIRSISYVPIIILTAKTQEEDKLRGFEYGADEYVTKPFSPKVLVARVNSLVTRVYGKDKSSIYSKNNLAVDFDTGKVIADNKEILLTKKEFDLLCYLIKNKGIILSKDSILNSVWGYDYYGDPRTVDTHMKRLRKKLLSKSTIIKTIRGRGYIFEDDENT